MAGHPDPEEVMAWVDGHAGAEVGRHVESCASCGDIADEFRALSGQMAGWQVPPAVFDIPAPDSAWRIPWRWVTMAALVFVSLFVWSFFGSVPAPQTPAPAPSPILIEVFIDWQCPTCVHLEYAPVIDAMQAEKPGSVQFVLRDYPLNRRCNTAVTTEVHAAACEAAAAVRMARERGKADVFIGWVMTNQKAMTPDAVKAQARAMLGVTDFDAEYAKKLPEIQADIAKAVALKVKFTPAVFVNGKDVSRPNGSSPSPIELERMIRELLGAR